MVKRGALLKNERLKLYKRPSTWIIMGIIVLLTLLSLFFMRMAKQEMKKYTPDWQEGYNSELEGALMSQKENPDDVYFKQRIEAIKYLIENKIEPLDWRLDVVNEYYKLKYPATRQGELKIDEIKETDLNKDKLEKLKAIIVKKDWRSYINLKIDEIKNGKSETVNDQEKQVSIEIYELYLKNDIVPISKTYHDYIYWDIESTDLTWKSNLIESIHNNKLNLLRGENEYEMLTNTQRDVIQQDIDVALKRLSTNTAPISSDSFLGYLESASSMINLISILLIVYAGNIFATEYTSGTIKLLLITPHKRKKIFWAKAMLMLELAIIALIANFVVAFLMSGAFTGFKGIGSMQVLYLFGNIVRMPYLLFIVFKYLLLMLPVLAYGALALMLSVVTRKSAVSIAITFVLMFGSQILIQLLVMLRERFVIPGVKFLFFANISLENYLPSAQSMMMGGTNNSLVDGSMTLGFSVAVLLVYTICFLWIARDSFCRRDVK